MVPAALLRELGIEPRERMMFELADGRTVERAVGEARFHYNGRNAVSPVIFGEESDGALLGVVTLEALGLEVDPVRRQIRPTRMILY
jgi:predicted aspartyl protease